MADPMFSQTAGGNDVTQTTLDNGARRDHS
jgi:hypothetical protein